MKNLLIFSLFLFACRSDNLLFLRPDSGAFEATHFLVSALDSAVGCDILSLEPNSKQTQLRREVKIYRDDEYIITLGKDVGAVYDGNVIYKDLSYLETTILNVPNRKNSSYSNYNIGDLMKLVVMHEIGHALGLEHTEKIVSIMDPRVILMLPDDAIKSLVELLNKNNLNHCR